MQAPTAETRKASDMAVYVDDMAAKVRMRDGRTFVFCHMVADSEAELHAMADRIGVRRKWYQYPEKSRYPHYDITLSKRALAISEGAIEISQRQAPAISRRCRDEIHARAKAAIA